MRDVQEAARIIDRPLRILKASTDSEIDAAFATFAQPRTGGLVVATDPFFNSRREKLVALAARHAVPAIYEWREFAQAGGLISYGPKPFRHLSSDWGLCRPGSRWCQSLPDLPIQRPTQFELVINLKAAKALGLIVPQSILARADEVIR